MGIIKDKRFCRIVPMRLWTRVEYRFTLQSWMRYPKGYEA